ncbi:hypothetical protein ROZALSC1DRAFT_24360 [Rozella allomycis CSF55]|uniref:Uncharacterized protein n=1 Tax=Rozella allomycis (strain CSF55) TaxID=988480 RepID=A0A4P9YFB0_ROZAC|nr:hypothetical protein ROZALSC1DRAFT_24360 [Rozella allomycis CSF55]
MEPDNCNNLVYEGEGKSVGDNKAVIQADGISRNLKVLRNNSINVCPICHSIQSIVENNQKSLHLRYLKCQCGSKCEVQFRATSCLKCGQIKVEKNSLKHFPATEGDDIMVCKGLFTSRKLAYIKENLDAKPKDLYRELQAHFSDIDYFPTKLEVINKRKYIKKTQDDENSNSIETCRQIITGGTKNINTMNDLEYQNFPDDSVLCLNNIVSAVDFYSQTYTIPKRTKYNKLMLNTYFKPLLKYI